MASKSKLEETVSMTDFVKRVQKYASSWERNTPERDDYTGTYHMKICREIVFSETISHYAAILFWQKLWNRHNANLEEFNDGAEKIETFYMSKKNKSIIRIESPFDHSSFNYDDKNEYLLKTPSENREHR